MASMKYVLALPILFINLLLLSSTPGFASARDGDVPPKAEPLRLGIVGLVHGHVGWILGRKQRDDVQIVGIAEPNQELAERLNKQYHFGMDRVYDSTEEMMDKAKPEAVVVFTSIKDHKKVTLAAAQRGIHVMVEKPLTFSLDDALAMKAAADSAGIYLLTDYETTWYGSVQRAASMVRNGSVGSLRKMVVHDGHQGPKEIGVGPAFLEWLTDPKENGGGALIDFGCYGANLITWFQGNRQPETVTAVTQQIKPEVYPKVDDEATIILTYPKMQGIIQASWNWPYSRKDMEIYGTKGAIYQDDATHMRLRKPGKKFQTFKANPRPAPYGDPFAYLASVIRGEIDPSGSLWSLENNMIVVKILDAARRSAKTGETIRLTD